MPQWKEHRPSILRPKFAKNLELGFLFCLVLFCLNQTTTSFKSFTRSNYSVILPFKLSYPYTVLVNSLVLLQIQEMVLLTLSQSSMVIPFHMQLSDLI